MEVETEPRFWSISEHWDTAREAAMPFPEEGEDLIIKEGWNMVLDLEETPIFNLIEINGRLSFARDKVVNLRAKKILIRGGEL